MKKTELNFEYLTIRFIFSKWMMTALVLIFLFNIAVGQKALIVGFNHDSPDGIAIVALEDLPSTEVLFLTETAYDDGTQTFNRVLAGGNSGTWQINWTGTWAKGTVIQFEGNPLVGTSGPGGPGTPSATSPYSDGVSFSNEGFVTFTASNTSDPDATPTEIYSYTIFNKSIGGANDPDPGDDVNCPCSAGFISVDLNFSNSTDHAQYRPSLRTDGTPENQAEFENAANWDGSTAGNVSLDLTAFTSIVLPVELTSFQVEKEGKEVKITWETVTEINNDYFTVEHSLDGTRFETLGTIQGAGDSFEPLNYSFRHTTPAIGHNYYRLKQIDFDGQFEFSKVISVNFRGKNEQVGEFYPNPSKTGIVNLEYASQNNDEINISVFDVTGKLVVNQIRQVSNGNNNLSFDFSKIITGIYIVKIDDKRNPTHRKLIIER